MSDHDILNTFLEDPQVGMDREDPETPGRRAAATSLLYNMCFDSDACAKQDFELLCQVLGYETRREPTLTSGEDALIVHVDGMGEDAVLCLNVPAGRLEFATPHEALERARVHEERTSLLEDIAREKKAMMQAADEIREQVRGEVLHDAEVRARVDALLQALSNFNAMQSELGRMP